MNVRTQDAIEVLAVCLYSNSRSGTEVVRQIQHARLDAHDHEKIRTRKDTCPALSRKVVRQIQCARLDARLLLSSPSLTKPKLSAKYASYARLDARLLPSRVESQRNRSYRNEVVRQIRGQLRSRTTSTRLMRALTRVSFPLGSNRNETEVTETKLSAKYADNFVRGQLRPVLCAP